MATHNTIPQSFPLRPVTDWATALDSQEASEAPETPGRDEDEDSDLPNVQGLTLRPLTSGDGHTQVRDNVASTAESPAGDVNLCEGSERIPAHRAIAAREGVAVADPDESSGSTTAVEGQSMPRRTRKRA